MPKLTFKQFLKIKILLGTEGIGSAKILRLSLKFGDLNEIYSADLKALQEVDGISELLAHRIKRAPESESRIRRQTEAQFDRIETMGGFILSIWDNEYPENLKRIYDPPVLLYCLGNITEEDKNAVAVVGTRNPTSYGRSQAERIASQLALHGITVVSGLARGIDSVAHGAALKNSGRTIAVIGSGLDIIYPAENKNLFREITKQGAVISEYEPGTKPDAGNFPKRNRIISGLSLAAVVIESPITGGAMQTAALALDQNRDIFAVPGNLGIPQSEGPNTLIQRGEAMLLRDGKDILHTLGIPVPENVITPGPVNPVQLNVFEDKIISNLSDKTLQIEEIALSTGLPVSECLVNLLTLEFKGLVKQLPGKNFRRI